MAAHTHSSIDALLAEGRTSLTRGSTSDATLHQIDAALAEARGIGSLEVVAKCLLYKANHFMIAGDYSRSVALCEEGLAIAMIVVDKTD